MNKEISNFLRTIGRILNQFGDSLKEEANIKVSLLQQISPSEKINIKGTDNKLCDVFKELVVMGSRMQENIEKEDTPQFLASRMQPHVSESSCKRNITVTGMVRELCDIFEEMIEAMTHVVSYLKTKESTPVHTLISHTENSPSDNERATMEAGNKEEMTNNMVALTTESERNIQEEVVESRTVLNGQVKNSDGDGDHEVNIAERGEIESFHSCGYGGAAANEEAAYRSQRLSYEGLDHKYRLIEEIESSDLLSGQHETSFPQANDHDFVIHVTGEEGKVTDNPENYILESYEADVEPKAPNITEADNTAEERTWKGEMALSDVEYESLTTEDEEPPSATIPEVMEDFEKLLELSAIRMFRKHMETDGVSVDVFPTQREQPTKYSYYTCRVLEFEAIGCGRSKKAAKRNAMSKIIRLIVKRHEEGSLPKEISSFSSEELSALVDVRPGGDDYLSQLRRLCASQNAPPPVFHVQISRGHVGHTVFTVQCCALGRTAVRMCAKKRSAKRHAALEIIKRYEDEVVSARS